MELGYHEAYLTNKFSRLHTFNAGRLNRNAHKLISVRQKTVFNPVCQLISKNNHQLMVWTYKIIINIITEQENSIPTKLRCSTWIYEASYTHLNTQCDKCILGVSITAKCDIVTGIYKSKP